jgi:hypothetical protein
LARRRARRHAGRLSPAGQRWLNSVVAAQSGQAHRLVVVALPGSDSGLQRQRAQGLRERLTKLGLSSDQIYFEATSS